MKTNETKMIVKYLDKQIKFPKINEYSVFLKKLNETFSMKNEEIESLKLYKLDDDNDELLIENEKDFNDNLETNQNNEIIYIMKTKERKKEKKVLEKNNKKIKNIMVTPNEKKKVPIVNNNIDYSKIEKIIIEQNKILKNEILEEVKKINLEREKELKNNFKKKINDIKGFLITLDETIKKNYDLNESMIGNMNNSQMDNKINSEQGVLKNIEKDIKKINSSITNNTNFKNELEIIKEKLNEIMNEINNQSIIVSKVKETQLQIQKDQSKNPQFKNLDNIIKEEEEENENNYACHFINENIELKYNYDDLIKMKDYKFSLNIKNTGNLSWPKNSMIYGKSEDNELDVESIINSNNEVLPNQQINSIISLTFKNIKNENKTYILPLKLVFQDESINIKQNLFKLQLTVEELKKINDQSPLNPLSDNKLQDNNNEEIINYVNKEPMKRSFITPGNNLLKINYEKNHNEVTEEGNSDNINNDKKVNYMNDDNDNDNIEKIDNFNILQNDDVDDNEKENNNILVQNNVNISQKIDNNNIDIGDNFVNDDLFEKIKIKLKEDYEFNNEIWNDEELKEKIKQNVNIDIKNILERNEEEGIEKIAEFIGEELLDI